MHTVEAAGQVLLSCALPHDRFIAWCMQLPAGCIVAMETSSGRPRWARKLDALGLDHLLQVGYDIRTVQDRLATPT